MAKKWSNKNLPGALHFVTGNVRNRKPIFKNEQACLAFLNELQELRTTYQCKLCAFVVMPDHFHLVMNPEDGNIQTVCGILKSLTAKALVKIFPKDFFYRNSDGEHQVWQESFKALPLWSDYMIKQKVDYVHSNPIRAKLVNTTEDYRWSSFNASYRNSTDPLLQIDKEWWWPGDVQKLERAIHEWNQEKLEKPSKVNKKV